MMGRIRTGEALFDEEALAALLAGLARAAGARSTMVLWRHLDGVHEVMAFNHHTEACVALYASKYAAVDPWLKAARAASRRGELLCLDDCVTAATVEKSRLYREFLRPQGDDTFHAAVAVFDGEGGEAILCLHRGRAAGPFTPADLDPLAECLPQLGRVLCTRGETIAGRRREQVARDELDSLGLAAIVVGADGAITRANLIADPVLRRADGFRMRAGLLSCVDPGSRLRLQAAVALATAPDNAMATAIPVERVRPNPADRGERPLGYMVSVTPFRDGGDRPLAMLVFRDPDSGEDSFAGRLRALFRPARAEAAVAAAASRPPAAVRVVAP
jgi:hypothetical protein